MSMIGWRSFSEGKDLERLNTVFDFEMSCDLKRAVLPDPTVVIAHSALDADTALRPPPLTTVVRKVIEILIGCSKARNVIDACLAIAIFQNEAKPFVNLKW
jgi:hypothetical protein